MRAALAVLQDIRITADVQIIWQAAELKQDLLGEVKMY